MAATVHSDLFTAISKGQIHAASKLLDLGTNVNATKMINKVLYTPLMLAAEKGHDDIVRLLLERNDIDVNPVQLPQAKKGLTPLYLAAMAGHLPVVKELLKLGSKIDTNITVERNVTPLQAAMMRGHTDVVDALWPYADDKIKQRCLHAALESQKFETVAALIQDRGLDVNIMYQDALLLEFVAPFMDVKGLVYLLEKDLPIKIDRSDRPEHVSANPDHNFSWATFVDPSAVTLNDSIAKETVVDALVDSILADATAISRAHVMQALLASTDQHNRPVVALADASLVTFMKSQTYLAGRYEIADGPPIHIGAASVIVQAVDHGMYAQVFDEYADDDGVLNVDAFVDCNHVLCKLAPGSFVAGAGDDVDDAKMREESWIQAFDALTPDNECIDVDDFRRFCEATYGPHLKVAMKFMRHVDDYTRERQLRHGLCSHRIVGLLPIQADLSVLQSLRLTGYDIDLAEFPHVIVMPAGGRSLADMAHHERPQGRDARSVLHQVAASLDHLHNHGFVHGNLSTKHVLSMQGQLKLIDFTATAQIGVDHVGAKWSSACLPPEMFYQLRNDAELAQYAAYWRDQSSSIPDRNALRPRSNFVVRAFCRSASGHALPYTTVRASTALDAWAFGCMMFDLITGTSLVPSSRSHDILPTYVATAATWTDEKLRQRVVEAVHDPAAQQLLLQLLVVEPSRRLTMDQVVDHVYFSGGPHADVTDEDDFDDWVLDSVPGDIARTRAKRNLHA
ncbi:serine/threonine protein kinase [Aphanomyces invadans]|uniref:Serine/threonine protein kinase n=1 Tax=Aphanomyces invadans TaxID=157072 RepID=A0A024TQZ6_9STRA|nr:serine/threonine protein kinase [Aphanomyces invadans]ETV96423.1 serine/threonine protein kinase [Aphanomyces invadans]|eukprot:XP_008874686.1 serine/threonine protein kinase [Aphanomyces invadans]